MIEMDESEYLYSPLEDWQLLLVLLLMGWEAHDQLLYEGEAAYGLLQLAERGTDGGYQTRLERNDHRPIGDGAAPGEWREEDHPAEVAETLPP